MQLFKGVKYLHFFPFIKLFSSWIFLRSTDFHYVPTIHEYRARCWDLAVKRPDVFPYKHMKIDYSRCYEGNKRDSGLYVEWSGKASARWSSMNWTALNNYWWRHGWEGWFQQAVWGNRRFISVWVWQWDQFPSFSLRGIPVCGCRTGPLHIVAVKLH